MNCRGMALLTGLVLLAAISLLAVTAAGSMALQRQQTANYEDKLRAAAEAETARLHALAWLFSRTDSERQADCETDCLLPAGINPPGTIPDGAAFETESWWRANAIAAGTNPLSGEPVGFAAPSGLGAYWILEEIHFEPGTAGTHAAAHGVAHYRILARGKGLSPRAVAVIEAIVARPWGEDPDPAGYPPDPALPGFCSQFDETLACGSVAWRTRR